MLLKLSLDSDIWLWMLRLWLRIVFAWLFQCRVFAAEPSFRVPPENVTVIEGDMAVLPCSINHLTDEHDVVWTDGDGFLLTLNDKRVIDDQRLSVERPYRRLWNLHIRDVQYEDKGKYVCQINTKPFKHREVVLEVLVPPYIVEQYSSNDMTVQEGDTVTLVCNATGYPQPEIRWFRYTSEHMRQKEKIGKSGEVLIVHNVSRDCGGTYVCEADNNVDKMQTREITLSVQFPPEVILPVAKLGQHPGKETFLQCKVTANPHGVMYWERFGVDLTNDRSGKYMVEIFESDYNEEKVISLRIREIQTEDFGQYTCYAENFVGDDKETMILYDYSVHHRLPTTTTPRALIVQPPVIFNPGVDREDNFKPPRQPPLFDTRNENTGAIRGYNSASTITGGYVYNVLQVLMSFVLFVCHFL